MTEISISTYAGRQSPEATMDISAFERASNISQAKPTTGEVVGSYVEETFQGAGSGKQDIQAMNIRLSKEADTAYSQSTLSEDDWKRSINFRDGLTYHPTMTTYESEVLASRYDQKTDNELIQSKATGLQKAAGFGVGFLSGVVEPKNLVSGVAAALVTGGVGAAIPSVGRVISVNTVRSAAGRGAVEGVVGAAMTEPLSISSAKQLQDDYTFADSMMNLALGSVLGAGLGAGDKALELRGRGKKLEEIQAYRAERGIAIKEMDTALAQTVQGSAVDVTSVKQLDNAEVSQRARLELPRIEEKIAATGVTKVTDMPEFKTWFGGSKVINETGVPQVVYHGTSKDIATFDTKTRVSNPVYGQGAYFAIDPKLANDFAKGDGSNIVPAYIKLENPFVSDANIFRREFAGVDKEKITQTLKEQGYDGIIINRSNKRSELVVFEPGQIKSVFNRGKFDPNDPRLIDAERLQVRKGQAESDARIQTDNAPIKKLQDDLARPDNSTAYNPNDSLDIQKYLDDAGDMEDQIRLEQEFEGLAEEIAELKSQGLLNKEELGILENLSNINKESAIFDNILLNAKICLTRG